MNRIYDPPVGQAENLSLGNQNRPPRCELDEAIADAMFKGNPGNTDGHFNYHAKYGRASIKRFQHDATPLSVPLQFAVDCSSLLHGWAEFHRGGKPEYRLVPAYRPHPLLPDRDGRWRRAVSVIVLGKSLGGVYLWRIDATVTIRVIRTLVTKCTRSPEGQQGEIPVVELTARPPNYNGYCHPCLNVVRWVPHPLDYIVPVTPSADTGRYKFIDPRMIARRVYAGWIDLDKLDY